MHLGKLCPAFGALTPVTSLIYTLPKNDSLNHFCLRLIARLIGVPITPALWGEEEPPHKVKAYLRDTPTAYGERRRDTVAFESLLARCSVKNGKAYHSRVSLTAYGAPKGIRTPDLSLRRRTLYPAELRRHLHILYIRTRLLSTQIRLINRL